LRVILIAGIFACYIDSRDLCVLYW